MKLLYDLSVLRPDHSSLELILKVIASVIGEIPIGSRMHIRIESEE